MAHGRMLVLEMCICAAERLCVPSRAVQKRKPKLQRGCFCVNGPATSIYTSGWPVPLASAQSESAADDTCTLTNEALRSSHDAWRDARHFVLQSKLKV